MLNAVDAFAFNMVSYAKSTNQEWPFVTLPNFPERAFNLLSHSPAFAVATYPVVTRAQFHAWSDYAANNDSWV